MLELKNIELSFTDSRKDVFKVLSGVNLSVHKGETTALIGGNGTGKTTLFNIISGFQKRYKGDVVLEGKNISSSSPYSISNLGVGRMFQGRQIMRDLTLLENMIIASGDTYGEFPFSSLFNRGKLKRQEKEKEDKAIQILKDLFGEDNKYLSMLNHKGSDFSYGEQRLIALARLLMSDNKLLLLDEPTAGVNPIYIDTIRDIILKMVKERGITVFFIEHNMHFVGKLADKCAYLDDGVVEKYGKTEDILNDTDVRNSYLGL